MTDSLSDYLARCDPPRDGGRDIYGEPIDDWYTEVEESTDARRCEHCGERATPSDSWAEVAPSDGVRYIVHAEPCAEELIAQGWSIA